MALTTSYLTSVKNFEGIMNSILGARAPERFTNKFLEDLGYKSSNDRLILGVLKSLGLLNDTGEPTQRYYDFLDQTQSKKVIATGIQEAYEDLFNLKRDAQNMSQEEVKNKLKTLTQGSKGVSTCLETGEILTVPARPAKVVDTTGAGDAFFAGVAIGMTYGKELKEAVEIGTRLAASVIITTDNVCPRFLPKELGLDIEVEE